MKKRVRLGLLWCGVVLLCALGARGQFVQEQKIANDPNLFSSFGDELAIEGNLMAVSARFEETGPDFQRGAVYLYEKSGNNWSQTARLAGDKNQQRFGTALAIVNGTIIIKVDSGPLNQVALRFYEKVGSDWMVKQTITLSTINSLFYPSSSLAVRGNTLALGLITSQNRSGSVFLFTKNGSQWVEEQVVVGDDVGTDELFGRNVALDENTLVVSNPIRNNVRGKVYLFEKKTGTWQQTRSFVASDAAVNDGFGATVAISGGVIMVAATGVNVRTGAVYVFAKNGETWPSTETQKFTASDAIPEATFGNKLTLVDGRAVIGAVAGSVKGVYVFERNGADWIESQKVIPNETFTGLFGNDVELVGNTIYAGDPGASGGRGAVYTFTPAVASEGQSLSKVRLFPRPDCCEGRTVGGKVQVSAVGKFGPWKTVAVVKSELPHAWNELTVVDQTTPYEAIRYLAPKGGYGNVAEAEFFNGGQKLSGTVFADAGGSWNGLPERAADKAFDGNTQTYYDANNANDSYVGLELTNTPPPPPPTPCSVTKVRIFPRPDCCAGRTLGGQIQVSTIGKDGPWQTAITITKETAGQWSEFEMANFVGPYKAVRYLAPAWGYGNVAEIEFYSGEQKLQGALFHDGGGSWNGLQDRTADKVFDGNTQTYYDANNANGTFVGMELADCTPPPPPTSCALTSVIVKPRLNCCSGRTIGAKIQVSTVGKDGPWQTIHTVDFESPGGVSFGIRSDMGLGPFKAVRYLAPDWSYGNVAEVEFYNRNEKLTGTAFADGGGPWNGLQDRNPSKAFDSDPATFYDANNANGAYVGLELTGCSTSNARLSASEAEIAEAIWSLQVAPNPSAGRVKAQVMLPQAARFTLTLTNVLGQELHRREVPGEAGANAVEVDFSPQPTGLYLLRVQTEGQKPLVQKLLKRTE